MQGLVCILFFFESFAPLTCPPHSYLSVFWVNRINRASPWDLWYWKTNILRWLIKRFAERRRVMSSSHFPLLNWVFPFVLLWILFITHFSFTFLLWGMGRGFKFTRHFPLLEFRVHLLILFGFVFILTDIMLDLNRVRNCAFVDFKSEALATQAHRQLNGYLFFILDKVVLFFFYCNSSCSICSNSIRHALFVQIPFIMLYFNKVYMYLASRFLFCNITLVQV